MLGAERFGLTGVISFIIVHWTCDLVWFTLLSNLSNRGVEKFGSGLYRGVSVFCGGALILFGVMFIYHAGLLMLQS